MALIANGIWSLLRAAQSVAEVVIKPRQIYGRYMAIHILRTQKTADFDPPPPSCCTPYIFISPQCVRTHESSLPPIFSPVCIQCNI